MSVIRDQLVTQRINFKIKIYEEQISVWYKLLIINQNVFTHENHSIITVLCSIPDKG